MAKPQNTIIRRPPQAKPRRELEDQVLSLTPAAVRSQLPVRVGGEFGLDVIVTELGGPQEFVKYCRLSNNPKIQTMVRLYEQSSPEVKKNVSFQQLCGEMFIDAVDVLTDIVTNLYLYHGSMARMVNALAVKDVMEVSARMAKTDEGFDDRKLQLDIAGLLPKKGPLVNVNVGDPRGGVEDLIEEMDAIDVQPED